MNAPGLSFPETAPPMGKIARGKYTHQDMIDFIIANPDISQKELAGRYGYTQSWVSNIMASDVWQATFDARRKELVDPGLSLTLEQRMKALTQRSIEVLMEKLDQPSVSDQTALKALELGARAVNVGGQRERDPATAADHLAQLANRLIDLQSERRKGIIYESQATVIPTSEEARGDLLEGRSDVLRGQGLGEGESAQGTV